MKRFIYTILLFASYTQLFGREGCLPMLTASQIGKNFPCALRLNPLKTYIHYSRHVTCKDQLAKYIYIYAYLHRSHHLHHSGNVFSSLFFPASFLFVCWRLLCSFRLHLVQFIFVVGVAAAFFTISRALLFCHSFWRVHFKFSILWCGCHHNGLRVYWRQMLNA